MLGPRRHHIGALSGKLDDWRRIHTRHGRCAQSHVSAMCFLAPPIVSTHGRCAQSHVSAISIAATILFRLPQ